MSLPVQADQADRQGWFAGTVRFVIAPLILLSSGFFTADFLLSGLYTWPRTSRVLVLTLTIIILSYEFIYKEQRVHQADPAGPVRALVYSCMIPYALGALALLVLARISLHQ